MAIDVQSLEAARSRTDAKLRYAAVHLDELRHIERRGDDFERAHQESFLFHFFGVRDSYLQELNIAYETRLQLNKVTIRSLEKSLADTGRQSSELKYIANLEADQTSWLSRAKELRDHSTHRASVPRLFHVGGENHGKVFLHDTRNGDVIQKDFFVLFENWLESMKNLIRELRDGKL